jgi:hypothetical protein
MPRLKNQSKTELPTSSVSENFPQRICTSFDKCALNIECPLYMEIYYADTFNMFLQALKIDMSRFFNKNQNIANTNNYRVPGFFFI